MIDYRRFCAKFTQPGPSALGGEIYRSAPVQNPEGLIRTEQGQERAAILWLDKTVARAK